MEDDMFSGIGGGTHVDGKVLQTLQKSFVQVQNILDRNRLLITAINQNQESKIPDNLSRNVGLIRESNRRVADLYADLSNSFVKSMEELLQKIKLVRMGGPFDVNRCDVRTVVLVGKVGNGKSATANSLLGRKVFKSKATSSSVTATCEMQQTVLDSGSILNVIDTPGLSDTSATHERVMAEIVKCITMAKDGIHAVLLVLSVRSRFTRKEEAAIESLREIFGHKISDYMIVVFTGGDALRENGETLDDYLGAGDSHDHEPLKEILTMCGNRRVLFDNKTTDSLADQQTQLLNLVDEVVERNGGKPYTNELFLELHREETLKHKQMHYSLEKQLKIVTETVEVKLRETTQRFEQLLAVEHAARLRVEADALAARTRSDDEIREMRMHLERAQQENEELRRQAQSGKCAIL